MLITTNLLSVKQNIFLNTMTVIYKIKNGLYPEHILEKLQFVEDIHDHNTRSQNDFYVPIVKSAFAQNSLFHKGLIDFNNLPKYVKAKNFDNFKYRLRKFVIENYCI